jgi:hypothetical protein
VYTALGIIASALEASRYELLKDEWVKTIGILTTWVLTFVTLAILRKGLVISLVVLMGTSVAASLIHLRLENKNGDRIVDDKDDDAKSVSTEASTTDLPSQKES